MAAELRRFADGAPALRRAPRRGARPRSSTACRCPGWSSGRGRSRPTSSRPTGAHFTLRRRPRLRRPLPRRHRGDGRPRPGADDRRRRAPAAPRHHPHAPDRGRGVGRRGADPPVRRRVVAVRAVRHATRTAGSSASPATSPVAPRSSSTTTATTARSTRRSRCSAPDGSVVPVRGSVGPQVDVAETTRVVEFNDVDGLEAALADGDVAAVLIEPALTNVGIVLPEPGYHDAVREITRRTGTLLIIDETHTICAGPGGATGAWGLEPDMRRHRQDDRRRHPVGGLRLQPGGRGAGPRLDRGRGFRRRRDRRDARRLRPVAGRDPGDARRGPDRRGVRADDPARRALGGRRRTRSCARPASRGT